MNGMYEELLEKLRKNNRMSGWTHIDRLIDEAAEAIEALQAENKQLRAQLDEWKYEVKCHMDEVIAREKQIEQLRAQVARMKEALELCSWYGSEGLCIDEKLARKIMKALRPNSGTDYQNPTKKR